VTQAVILIGGKGSRLGGLTERFPKPLLDINGSPFITRVLDRLKRYGVEDVLLLAGHGFEHVEKYFHTPYPGLNISIHHEMKPMGTAGALKDASLKLESSFLLLNGDSIFDCNWLALIPILNDSTVIAMALRYVDDASRYGQVEFDAESQRVIQFKEKSLVASEKGLINGGVYAVNRDQLLPLIKGPSSLEVDMIPHLTKDGRVGGAVMSGYFIDIGVPVSLESAKLELDAKLSCY